MVSKMICRILIVTVLTAVAVCPLSAEEDARIAVLDFEVQSDNPAYKYLGKGFAEFMAVELGSVKGITIIEREKRNALLEEQEFALTDVADEATQIEIGNLLAARYLLTGSVFDVFGDLAVTIKLLDVESGSVVISEQADGPPKRYKRLIGTLSRAVVASMELDGEAVAAAPAEEEIEEEQAEEVLTAFSEAVDAVDRNDVTGARKSLHRAEKIDKTNKAVAYYLNKLFAASPKFNVELIFYAPSFNPASLGFVDKDRLYSTTSSNAATPFHHTYPDPPDTSHSDFNWEVVDGLHYSLRIYKQEMGYYLPVGKRLGFGLEWDTGGVGNTTRDENYVDALGNPDEVYLSSRANTIGGRFSAGWRVTDALALGLSGFLYNSRTNIGGSDGSEDPRANTLTGSLTLGLYAPLLEGKLTAGSHVTVPFLQEVYLDYSIKDYIAYRTAPYPVVWETSVVASALKGRLFLSLKEIAEIYTSFGDDDRKGVAARTIPTLEWWPFTFLSLRLGGEYDFLSLMGSVNHGFGVLGGLTARWRSFDIDVNYTLMQRTLRFYPGLTAPDGTLLVQGSWNGALKKERD